MVRFLVLFFVVCLVCSIYINPLALLGAWCVTAVGMYWLGCLLSDL